MPIPPDLAELQRDQYTHDMKNHFDILSLSRGERLKHYGLHFAKYVGRFARGPAETITPERTVTDGILVALSAANALNQDLAQDFEGKVLQPQSGDRLLHFADAAGRFADACEKIDHLEEFSAKAKLSNRDVFRWLIEEAELMDQDIGNSVRERRAELAARAFYVAG